jgi:predicted lipoprotein with Yx(FWY)xxD motif
VKRRILIPIGVLAVVAAIVAIAAAAGGGSSGGAYGSSATAATPTGAGPTSAVSTRTGDDGTYLVDGNGRALYLFEADKPNVSKCDSGCQSIWPGFKAGAKPPVAKGGALAGKLGVTSSAQGDRLVTYNGHPLYYYVGDKAPGNMNGQGLDQFGAEWYVLSPAGNKIDND